jgi:hypothetical protein
MKSVASIVVLLSVLTTTSQALVVSGTLSGNTTWSPANDTIKLTGDVRVRNGVTLVIQAGTYVRGYQSNLSDFYPRHIFTSANGAIQVNGTPDNQVDFRTIRLEWDGLTRDQDNWVKGAKMASAWGHGLCEFRNVSGSSEISYVLFENLEMPDCGSCGFYITSGGSPIVKNSTFTGGRCGVWAHGGGHMVFENCIFTGHGATGIISGGLGSTKALWEPMSCRIDHCVFNDIDGSQDVDAVKPATGYGVCTSNYAGTLFVTNTIFNNLKNGGIRDWNIEDPNCHKGTTTCSWGEWTVNTDYNCYYKLLGDDPVRLLPTGSHSIVDQDPLMNDPDNGDVSLKAGSPCLNAASDGTNIGVWQGGSSIHDLDLFTAFASGLGPVANPFRGSVVFNFESYDGAWLQIYNTQGQRVNRLRVRNNRVKWDGKDSRGRELVPGLYYYNLNADNFSSLRNIIKID